MLYVTHRFLEKPFGGAECFVISKAAGGKGRGSEILKMTSFKSKILIFFPTHIIIFIDVILIKSITM